MNESFQTPRQLSKKLKDFAFEESPMFQRDHVQEMAVSRSFAFLDAPQLSSKEVDKLAELPIEKRYKYFPVKTVIALGFSALRDRINGSCPPLYTFEVSVHSTTSILPKQLMQLSSRDTRDALYVDMTDNDVDFDEEDMSDDAHVRRQQRDDELLEVFHESSVDCERFQTETFRFDTYDEQVTSSFKYGYKVDEDLYQVCDSEEMMHGGYSESIETPEGSMWVDKSDQGADGPIDPNCELETYGLFAEIIKHLDGSESSEDDLLKHKSIQLLYVVECLRQKMLLAPNQLSTANPEK